MKVMIIYCHPSADSFTADVKTEFIKGLQESNHQIDLCDLYQEDFDETFKESEYLREAYYCRELAINPDVVAYQKRINQADALVFIYPVFWSEAPAKLVGWFQRVWTYGFAYGSDCTMKQLDKVLFLVTMGGDLKEQVRKDQVQAMKTVMLEDRINNRAKEKKMVVFDRMSRDYVNRQINYQRFLNDAFELGVNF